MLDLDYKEGWAPKVWCIKLWYWGRLLTVPWIAKRNQSNLKEINPEYSLERLMLKLKLKLQYFGHLMWRADSLEKTCCWERLKAGGEGDDRRWDGWMVSSTQWTWVWTSSRSWWWRGKPGTLQSTGSQSQTQLSNWTELNWVKYLTPLWVSFFFYKVEITIITLVS